jgi:hypothetical protein
MRAHLALLLITPLVSGCVTHWRGKEIEANLAALQAQVDLQSEQGRAHARKVEEMLETRLGDLERRLGEAIAQLQKGSADTGIDLEKMRDELKRVQGELAETREKLKTSEAAAELGVTVAPAPGETLPVMAVHITRHDEFVFTSKEVKGCTAKLAPNALMPLVRVFDVAAVRKDGKEGLIEQRPGSFTPKPLSGLKLAKQEAVADVEAQTHHVPVKAGGAGH